MSEAKKIRVAQIMGKLWSGGVEMVVFNYYRAIDKSKFQFDFYYDADSTVAPPQELIDMGARFIEVPPYQQLPLYLKTLKKHFEENKYVIVHSHINTLSVFPLYVAWKCGVPVRIAHNHSVPGGENWRRTALKSILKKFALVFPTDYLACSEKAGRWLFGNKNYDSGKVIVIKNAVDFSRFQPNMDLKSQLVDKLGLSGKLVIGCIGRFTFAKNHKFLIEIFEEIKKQQKKAILLLVGGGELDKVLHKIVTEKGLKDYVIFAGQVSNPENYYTLCDVVVVPSVFEGLSLTTIEAQIARVPVVISEAVPDEAVISNGCRRVMLTDSVEQWSKSIIDSVGKKVFLDERSNNYDMSKAVRRLEKLYLKLEQENNCI